MGHGMLQLIVNRAVRSPLTLTSLVRVLASNFESGSDVVIQGTAIYVFFVLANTIPDVTTLTACNFTLDGKVANTFRRAPGPGNSLFYNQLVFSENQLANSKHHLKISTGGIPDNVFVNFDYALYT